jgi:hypothetical protein
MHGGGIRRRRGHRRLFPGRILASSQQQEGQQREADAVMGPDMRQGRGHRGVLLFLGADSLCCLSRKFEMFGATAHISPAFR